VAPGAIPAATAAELARLQPGRIVVLGGTGVVSDAVKLQLRSYIGS
jgi:putative cell wall-binding protein